MVVATVAAAEAAAAPAATPAAAASVSEWKLILIQLNSISIDFVCLNI